MNEANAIELSYFPEIIYSIRKNLNNHKNHIILIMIIQRNQAVSFESTHFR